MTRLKQEKILLSAQIYYGAFPARPHNNNHKIIIEMCDTIKRIEEYRGSVRGAGALPQSLLERKYTEIWGRIMELTETLERGALAFNEARKSLEDAEAMLNWIFLGSK